MSRALIEHLGRIRQRHWMSEFTSQWHMSEYMVYGTFVESVVGIEKAGHYVEDAPLVHLSWGHDLGCATGVEGFFSALPADHVAIMIHSKDDVPVERYLHHVQLLWDMAEDAQRGSGTQSATPHDHQ